ncbi:NlpC/P60 family protein [Marinilactibacillus psychrotolerans]|uniref:C40 family peptidase n=1 Tax=Marinilactibacillus psychrotolerans TaxID=191770 RepID=UPI0039AED2D1
MKSKLIIFSATTTMLLSSVMAAPMVSANEYDTQIDEAKKQVEENKDQVDSLDETINSLESKSANTEAELTAINDEISKNKAFMQDAAERLQKAQAEYTTLQEDIANLEVVIEKRNGQLEDQARKIQVDGQTANYIEFVLDSESISDVIGRMEVVTNLMHSNSKLVEAQVRDKEEVAAKQEKTKQTIVQQNSLAEELELTAADLEQQQLEQEVLVAQLAAEKSTVESDRSEFLAQRDAAEAQVTQLLASRDEANKAAQEAQAQREQEEAQTVAAAETAQAEENSVVSTSSSTSDIQSNAELKEPAESNQNSNSQAPSNNSNSNSESNSNKTNEPRPAAPKPATPKPVESKPAASKPETPKPEPKPSGASWGAIKAAADSMLGTPYEYGSRGTSTFDCSGFTMWVFRQVGKSLPSTADSQFRNSARVSNPQPGDLVFFGSGGRATHVGIYAGGGQFVGAQTSTGVAYTGVHSSYWGPKFMGYGRY